MTAIVFDTETTGFTHGEIIEAAWVEIDEELLTSDELDLSFDGQGYCERFKPANPIELGALATHHIFDAELVGCRPSAEFCLPVGLQYMIGHNVDYDWKACGSPEGVKRICTLALSRWLYPTLDAHNQTAIMYHCFGREKGVRELVKNAHSALVDVKNCARILMVLIGEIQELGHTVDSFERLWELSEMARIPTHMPYGKHRGVPMEQVPADYKAWLKRQPDTDPYLLKALEAK